MSPTLANKAKVARANAELVEAFDRISLNIKRLDRRFTRRFNSINRRFDANDQRLENLEKVNLARSMNSSFIRESALIEWIKKDNQRLPLQVYTLLVFHNLNNDQIMQFLQYHNLETNEIDNVGNKSRLMSFLSIPNQNRI